jgi:hypothetical protein
VDGGGGNTTCALTATEDAALFFFAAFWLEYIIFFSLNFLILAFGYKLADIIFPPLPFLSSQLSTIFTADIL